MDANEILASMLVGTLGAGLLVYAKKQERLPHGVVGVPLMVYPYFVPNVIAIAAIAGALLVALWGATRLGW
jgi:hypothetical protein